MVDMSCLSLAIDPVPDQVAQNRAVDILFVEIIRRQDVPPFFNALDLFGFSVDGIAGTIMFYIADDALLHFILVTMATVAVTDIPDGEYLFDAVSVEERT